jgi:hypothetical protein
MATKKAVLKQLADYFAKKGQMMSPAEYKANDDAPIRFMVAKRPFGSWARMQQMIEVNFPKQWAVANKLPISEPAPKAAAAAVKAKAKTAPKKAKK